MLKTNILQKLPSVLYLQSKKKEKKNVWFVITTDLMTNFPFQL